LLGRAYVMERFSELEKSTVNQLLQAITVHDDPARIIHGAVKAAESLGTNPNFRNLNELFLRVRYMFNFATCMKVS
jgi:hypothetical protein